MSDSPLHSLAEQVRWRWQIPLLALSLLLLALGLWRLKPAPRPPAFDSLYAQAVALRDAELYPEASKYLEQLLIDPQRLPEERAKLRLLMAEVMFAHEQRNSVHAPQNVRGIIEHTDNAVADGASLDAEFHEMRAMAWEWLKRPAEALKDYREAVTKAPETARSWDLRKRILEIQKADSALKPEELHREYEAMLAGEQVSDELRYWAAEQNLELLEEENKPAEAERFLAGCQGKFTEPMWQRAYQYLQALAWYRTGRDDDAERLLRSLRDQLVPGDPVYARCGWLLGKLLQRQESPEAALGFFDDVVNSTTPSHYRTACILGRGEALAALERFNESAEAFNDAIRMTAVDPYGAVVDLQVARESTTALYQVLLTQGELMHAMEYLRLAARLAPPTDVQMQAQYAERLGDLAAAIGRAALERAEAAPDGDQRKDNADARRWLREAGDEYLRLAKLSTFDNEAAAEAAWRAADAYDLGGQRDQTIAVLEAFLHEQPESTRAPMALLRLGQAQQASGDYSKAVATYQRNLTEFPRTPSAVASLVPLAECFLQLGDPGKAETTLLRMLAPQPSEGLALITPAAGEFRDALFKLAALYTKTGQLDKAIARYEEALERYPDDPRCRQADYLLADTYRQSAAQLRAELSDPRNIAQKDELLTLFRKRLQRARQLYDATIERYHKLPEASCTEVDRNYLKLSHFYRADTVYDLAMASPQPDPRVYAEALDLYDRAAWLYQTDPMAMAAYIQMINCQLRLGHHDRARMTLQRARWTLRGIPAERFAAYAPDESAGFWEEYLSWLERTPTLSGS